MSLGKKRSNSLFAADAIQRENVEFIRQPEQEIVPVIVDDAPERTFTTEVHAGRAHNLFFTPESEGSDFGSVLRSVQEYISGTYSELVAQGGEEAKEQLKRYITKFLQDKRIAVSGMTQEQLVDALYSEMAEYGFLTKYIFGDGIEEININSWRDIEVQYRASETQRSRRSSPRSTTITTMSIIRYGRATLQAGPPPRTKDGKSPSTLAMCTGILRPSLG